MNTDRIVSVSAIVVAVGTLFIIIYQTSLMQSASRASVLPYLQIAFSSNESGSYISIGNRGVGPALIDRISIQYQDETIEGDPYQLLLETDEDLDQLSGLYIDRVLKGMLIPSGATIRTIGAIQSPQLAQLLVDTFSVNGIPDSGPTSTKAVIEIQYSSIYGDQWLIRSDQLVPLEN